MAKRAFDANATLNALLGPVGAAELTSQDQLRMVAMTELSPTPHQPRSSFPEEGLRELAESIRANGILQPLLVRPVGQGFEIVAGERRWRAARMAGLDTVPAYVRQLSEEQAAAASAVENLMRENLNPLEEVEAKRRIAALALQVGEGEVMGRLRRLLDRPEEDKDGVARLDLAFQRLGGEKWESFLRNKGRLLNLPEDVRAAVRSGLDYRKALVIGAVNDPKERGRLIGLAASGATVQALRAERRPAAPPEEVQWRVVAQALGRKRATERLGPRERARVNRLVAELHRLLGGEGN